MSIIYFIFQLFDLVINIMLRRPSVTDMYARSGMGLPAGNNVLGIRQMAILDASRVLFTSNAFPLLIFMRQMVCSITTCFM